MNAHTKIQAAPVDRMDELVALLTDNIAAWHRADKARDRYQESRISSRRCVIEAESSWLPCRSAAAALLKLCVMESEINAALTHIEDDDILQNADDLLRRHVGSIIRWIEQEFGIRRDDYGLHFYHTDRSERGAWCMELNGTEELPS